MRMKHLRYFLAVAEELDFTRAAQRMQIDQSPVSRAIKDLEDELGVLLLYRDRRGTRLTHAGNAFLQDVRRVFDSLDKATSAAKAAACGYRDTLCIAVSDQTIGPRLSTWLARCREEEPQVALRIVEVSLAEQLRGLRDGHFDAGFAQTAEAGQGIVGQPVWHDTLLLAMPVRHPLLIHPRVPMAELVRYPILGTFPGTGHGGSRHMERSAHAVDDELCPSGSAMSVSTMLTLVGAGYGLGLLTAAQMAIFHHPDVVVRPILDSSYATLTTYILRLAGNDSNRLDRSIARLGDQSKSTCT